jgi:hypothetical protein
VFGKTIQEAFLHSLMHFALANAKRITDGSEGG